MNVSYVTTPGGEELAILPRAELEDIIASAKHAHALVDYRAGRDPGLDAQEMRAFLAAPTPLAFWRRKRGLTQAALAAQTQLAQNYVSELENGKRAGSPGQWLKLARALDVRLEELIEG
jgi:DNA-binding XRE family transcriptional regulator